MQEVLDPSYKRGVDATPAAVFADISFGGGANVTCCVTISTSARSIHGSTKKKASKRKKNIEKHSKYETRT